MNNTHKIILFEDIQNAPNQTLNVHFEEFIKEIPSKTPLKADLEIKDLGEFIEVKGAASSILNLECDRCLTEFEYEIEFEIDEMFAKQTLQEKYSQEFELTEGQFITDLNGVEEIDVYDLLYQSVIINLPNKKVCGINCNEDDFETDENLKEVDPRLEVFKQIKIE